MNEVIQAMAYEFESEDSRERSRAAMLAGNYGHDAIGLLPRLMEMISQNQVTNSVGSSFGEFISVGRILRSIENLKIANIATDEMVQLSDDCISALSSQLESATEAKASLLIHTLALIGPRTAPIASVVLKNASSSEDQRMKYRAYQFACSVRPELTSTSPWLDFAPANAEDRLKWGAL